MLVVPILSRLYTPDAFGTAAVFVSIAGIISIVSCFRYELAIMLPEQLGMRQQTSQLGSNGHPELRGTGWKYDTCVSLLLRLRLSGG